MKKTLFASFFFPPEHGGIQTYTYNLIKHLPPEKVVVLAKNHPNAADFDMHQTFTVYRTTFDSPLKYIKLSNLSFYQELKTICHKENIEHIVLAHPLPLGTSAKRIQSKLNIPYSTFTHGMEITQTDTNSTQRALLKNTLSGAKNIFCTTLFMQKILNERFSGISEKISIIPPGINAQKPHIQKEQAKNEVGLHNKKVLLTVARLVKRKGHDIALKALKEAIKTDKNIHYVIVGTGPEKEAIQDIIKNLELTKYVTMRENINTKLLETYYAAADAFIMPSREIHGDIEGFGIVFLEAALFNTPSIGTKTGGISEAIKNNETGLLLDPPPKTLTNSYIKTTATAIHNILETDRNQQLGTAAKKRALSEFRWTLQANKLMSILSH